MLGSINCFWKLFNIWDRQNVANLLKANCCSSFLKVLWSLIYTFNKMLYLKLIKWPCHLCISPHFADDIFKYFEYTLRPDCLSVTFYILTVFMIKKIFEQFTFKLYFEIQHFFILRPDILLILHLHKCLDYVIHVPDLVCYHW